MKEKSEIVSKETDIGVAFSSIKIYMNDISFTIFKEKDGNFNIYKISGFGFENFINYNRLPYKGFNSNNIKKSLEYKIFTRFFKKILINFCKKKLMDEYYFSTLLFSRYINEITVSFYNNNFGNETLKITDITNKKIYTNKGIDITNIELKEKKDEITLAMKNFSSKENLANARKNLSSIIPADSNFIMDENKILKEDEKDILIEDIMNDKKNYMESSTKNNENINKMPKSHNQPMKGSTLIEKLGELEIYLNPLGKYTLHEEENSKSMMILTQINCGKSTLLNTLLKIYPNLNQAQRKTSEVNTHYIRSHYPLKIIDVPGLEIGEPNIMNEDCEDTYREEEISTIVNPNSLEKKLDFIYIYLKNIFKLYNKSLYENLLREIKFSPFTILLIGNTNPGKSTSINSLIGGKSFLVQQETSNTTKTIFLNKNDKDECIEEIIGEEFEGLISKLKSNYDSINEFGIEYFLDFLKEMSPLDSKEAQKTYEFEKKLKFLDFLNENRHFFCKKCYSIPIVKLEDNKLYIICNCEDGKFGKENKKSKNIFEYIINKNELINNEKENFMTSSFCCNKHIKKYKYYCKICQKNLCRKCLQNEKEHHNHDLVLFDSNLDEIDKKIDYIKQVINKKINKINNIYFNGNIIDIDELFTLIINDYSEYKSYNLIKSIENFYEFLDFKKKKKYSSSEEHPSFEEYSYFKEDSSFCFGIKHNFRSFGFNWFEPSHTNWISTPEIDFHTLQKCKNNDITYEYIDFFKEKVEKDVEKEDEEDLYDKFDNHFQKEI